MRASVWNVFDGNSTDETEINTDFLRGQIGGQSESVSYREILSYVYRMSHITATSQMFSY